MRAFVAIKLDQHLITQLQNQANRIQSIIGEDVVRWVRPEGVHLTLKFLGEIDKKQSHALQRLLREVSAEISPFVIRVAGFGCFPAVRKPRVLWVGVEEESGGLLRLQQMLDHRLNDLGFPREKRRFHPHLTLGRVKRHIRGQDLSQEAQRLHSVEIGSLGELRVDQIHLVRSELGPGGARYSTLGAFTLGERNE